MALSLGGLGRLLGSSLDANNRALGGRLRAGNADLTVATEDSGNDSVPVLEDQKDEDASQEGNDEVHVVTSEDVYEADSTYENGAQKGVDNVGNQDGNQNNSIHIEIKH